MEQNNLLKYKLMFLSEDFPPETNAAATRVYERALYWTKWGINVEFITCFPNRFKGKGHVGYSDDLYRIDYIDNMKIVRVKTFISNKMNFSIRAIHQISYMFSSLFAGILMTKPNAIISTTPQFFCGISGLTLSKLKKVPFILEVADIWTESIKGTSATSDLLFKLLLTLENYVYRKSNAIIVLTNKFKKEIISRGINANKIFVIKNGVNSNFFKYTGKIEKVNNQYGLKGKKIIGCIGTMGNAQGLLNVIKSAKIMQDKQLENIMFMFVGEGAEKERLIDLSRGLKNVIFVSGQPKEKIAEYYSMCDIGIAHLKNHEVFKKVIPSKIFEIMAMGLPLLLVSPKGEASKIVFENNVGKWIQSGDPELLVKTVIEMLSDNVLLHKYSVNSLNSINKFTREKQARKVLDVVETVLGQQ